MTESIEELDSPFEAGSLVQKEDFENTRILNIKTNPGDQKQQKILKELNKLEDNYLNTTDIKPGDKEQYMKAANEYLNILAKESFLSSGTN